MKTKLWMLGAAVAALTSCTQSEVVEIPESRVIGFDSFVGKNSRTAHLIQQPGQEAPTTKDNLHQFWVLGYEGSDAIFVGTDDNAKVYWNPTNSGFTYDNHKIWHLNKTYNFAAYSDGNNRLTNSNAVQYSLIGTTGSELVFNNYSVGENDLLAAIVPPIAINETGSNIAPVPLTFQHLLSCVKISLRNSSDNLFLKFDDITFNGVITDNCTYKIENAVKSCVWDNTTSATQTAATGVYTFDAPDDYLVPGATLNLIAFVIPQSNDGVDITITANSYKKVTESGQDYYNSTAETVYNTTLELTDTDNILPDHTKWQPGYQYHYSAEIAGTVHYIHFTVEKVENWEPHNTTLSTTSTTTEP